MTPIINPMWFYWIGVVDGIKNFLGEGVLITGTLLFFAIGAYFWFITEKYYTESDEYQLGLTLVKKYSTRSVILILLLLIIGLFIPSQATIIQMMAASYTTSDNLETASEVIKETVDYMFDKFEDKE